MIFYFTGTGNSWYAAKRLLQDDEQMINITECMQKKQFTFEVPEGEPLGFAFPVYYGGLPSIVWAFIKYLVINSPDTYTYAVITCGASIGDAARILKEALERADIGLDAVYRLQMPDNYAKMYEPSSEEDAAAILENADEELEKIRVRIHNGETTRLEGTIAGKMMTAAIYPLYVHGRKTKPFYADDRCVGCGACSKRCPVKAIEMVDKKPVWVKDRCVDCMACGRCNAIQYGTKMLKHRRYVNPEYKEATKCH